MDKNSKYIIGSPTEVQQADRQRFFVKDPKNFSPERNNAIVENSIKKYEAMRKKKFNNVIDNYGERADAVVSFIKSVDKGKGAQGNLEKYFSRKMLAYLRGQQIKDRLMGSMLVKNKSGDIIKPSGV